MPGISALLGEGTPFKWFLLLCIIILIYVLQSHLNSVISRKNKSIDFTADWGNLMQTKSNLYKLRVIILSLTMSKQAPILFELFCVCPLLF